MEEAALIISLLSLVVAGGGQLRNEARWRAERKRNVQVLVRHDGMGLDIYSPDRVEAEHVVAVRVFNGGERPEHVMWVGVESLTGEPLANDRPEAPKIIDSPPPEARELPARGQIAVQFKLSTEALADGFIGYAALGTGERIYSAPGDLDPALRGMQADVEGISALEEESEEPQPP